MWKLEDVGERPLDEFGKSCHTDKLQDTVYASGIALARGWRDARGTERWLIDDRSVTNEGQ